VQVPDGYLQAAGLIGVDTALQKPFDVEELLEVLRSMQ
jgi:DNA-binding response OmpR family regulator